jgi:hypothetical protein
MGNTVAVATTPEGFRFVYDRWVKNPQKGYTLFKAKTADNRENLPEGYIENLTNSYPEQLLQAYLNGEFVNLTSGSVYNEFDRHLNSSREVIQPDDKLHIGMDFNVCKMSAVVLVMRDGDPHAVDEIINAYDTPDMIRTIKDRYSHRQIMVYPDASGGSRKTVDASKSDIALLGQAGFHPLNNPSNPAIKDRVLSMNALIHKDGKRRLKVNGDRCPLFVEALEKQAYDDRGLPDKASGFDHTTDAGGYFIAYQFPINKPLLFTGIRSAC